MKQVILVVVELVKAWSASFLTFRQHNSFGTVGAQMDLSWEVFYVRLKRFLSIITSKLMVYKNVFVENLVVLKLKFSTAYWKGLRYVFMTQTHYKQAKIVHSNGLLTLMFVCSRIIRKPITVTAWGSLRTKFLESKRASYKIRGKT